MRPLAGETPRGQPVALDGIAIRKYFRYWDAVDWHVQAAASFNACSLAALTVYSVRDQPAYREVYYCTITACVCYILALLWSRREKRGIKFKAFVLQEGFVYSYMLEIYTWTWISIVVAVAFIAMSWASLPFYFSGSSLPGSRYKLWSLGYIVNLPTFLALDPVSSTTTFKEAALKKGFPGAAFFHTRFYARFALTAISCPAFLGAWLLVCAPGGLLMRYEYDLYLLYAQAVVLTLLLLFVLLPRHANMCKSMEALLENYSNPRCSVEVPHATESATGLQARLRLLQSSITGKRHRQRSFFGGAALSSALGGALCESEIDSDDSTAPLPLRDSVTIDVEASEDVHAYEVTEGALPGAHGGGADTRPQQEPVRFGHQDGTLSTPLPRLPELEDADIQPSSSKGPSEEVLPLRQGPRKSKTYQPPSRTNFAKGKVSASLSDQGPVSAWKKQPSAPVPSVLGRGQASTPGLELSEKRHSAPTHKASVRGPHDRSGRGQMSVLGLSLLASEKHRSASAASVSGRGLHDRLGSGANPSAIVSRENSQTMAVRAAYTKALGERPAMKNEAASFGEFADGDALGDVVTHCEIPGFDTSSRPETSLRTSSSLSRLRHRVTWTEEYIMQAMRTSGSPMSTVVKGLKGLPAGVRQLYTNARAALYHFKDNWRWWAAAKTGKFLYATGSLIIIAIATPVVEIHLLDSYVSKVVNGLALLLALVLNVTVVCGGLGQASEAMVLEEARKGGSIGSGLVYSTASILNSLTFGGPVQQGFVATEARLVNAAVVSCRWDAGSEWELEIREGRGTRKCRIMFPRVQLYRAALIARARGCDCMWIDSMSVPQQAENDPEDVAELKTLARRRLIPTMTAVYASARLVLIIETELGLTEGADSYNRRTWTLQECVLNENTAVIHLAGGHTMLGDAYTRRPLSGLTGEWLSMGMEDLESYTWVLEGEERDAAANTTLEQRCHFSAFADSRFAYRAADKAVALGQIFFRVFFEHVDVATDFMHEVAALLAADTNCTKPVMLIDNTGWDDIRMTGSACKTRYLMGRPSEMESGPPAMWHISRVYQQADRRVRESAKGTAGSAKSKKFVGMAAMLFGDNDEDKEEEPWWLCLITIGAEEVPVAIRPGMLLAGGHIGHLQQMRTCSPEERATIREARARNDIEVTKVLWM
eukprot:jgi/Tetstr1/463400/TSEL_008322.t1